ncbi:MAG: flagellar export chaperone FlgN [Solirubrobacteraceae bacterium]
MASLPVAPARDDALASEVIVHLDEQIASTRSLLAVVLEQGAAIRARDVKSVVRHAGILRGELVRREMLEERRGALLARCGERLGIEAEAVTVAALQGFMSPAQCEHALGRSSELKGLLHELSREHACNRALMQIELGFLDHLMGMLALDGSGGYDPSGTSTTGDRPRPGGALHVLDLRA